MCIRDRCDTVFDNKPTIAAFASSDRPAPQYFDFDIGAGLPFGQLLEHEVVRKTEKNTEGTLVDKDVKLATGSEPVKSGSILLDEKSCDAAPDIVTRTLKTPFASFSDASGKEAQEGDLGRFYRECQSAPSLSMFQQPSSDIRELLNSITDQLAQFEANAKEFDDFVNSFQEI